MDGNNQDEEARKIRIQKLVASIRESNKRKPVDKMLQSVAGNTRAKKSRGQRSEYNVSVGWQHFRGGKYRVVTKAKGGGSRLIKYTLEDTLTVENIKEKAIMFFFPNGKSIHGNVNDFHRTVGTASGQELTAFHDVDKQPCSFGEYLTSQGMFASTCHLYLRTKPIEHVEVTKKFCKHFTINNFPATKIDIKYRKQKQSSYAQCSVGVSCYSHSSCFEVSGLPSQMKETYDVFDDSFLVSRIVKGDTIYLQESDTGYECIASSSDEGAEFIHGPDIINGFEVDDENHVVIGAITQNHNNNCMYTWYRNGHVVCAQDNHCLLRVTEAGNYTVSVNNIPYRQSAFVDIVTIEVPTLPSATCVSDTLEMEHSAMDINDFMAVDVITESEKASEMRSEAPTSLTSQMAQSMPLTSQTQSMPLTYRTQSMPLTSQTQSMPPTSQTQSMSLTYQTQSMPLTSERAQSMPLAYQTQSMPLTSERAQSMPLTYQTQSMPLTSQTQSMPLTSEMAQSMPLTFQTQSMPLTSEMAQSMPLRSQTQSMPLTSERAQSMPLTSQTQSMPLTSQTQSMPLTSQTQSMPLTSQTQSMPPTSQTQSMPLTYQTQSMPLTSERAQSMPLAYQTQSMPLTSERAQSMPLTYQTQSMPLTSQTQSMPLTSEMAQSMPLTFQTQSMPLTSEMAQSMPLRSQTQSMPLTSERAQSMPLTSQTQSMPLTSQTQSMPLTSQTQSMPLTSQTQSMPLTSQTQSMPRTSQTQSMALTSQTQSMPLTSQTQSMPLTSQTQSMPRTSQTQSMPLTSQMANPMPLTSQVVQPMPEVPKISLNDITLGAEIGRGGFGVVFRGTWVGTKVAIKEITVKRMKISKSLIDRELCLHSKVRHPNIVMLMAYATEINKLYLVSELIDGDTLDNVLFGCQSEATSMSMPIKMSVSSRISQAVAYLHSQKPVIIHRDIKPENILVADNFKVVKLCDMGLSKLKTMNTIMTTMAGGSMQPGTPIYQAPEALLERHSANTMTDIWSLSCTLVETLCEMPIWNIPEDTDKDTVESIMDRMRMKAKPDGLGLLAGVVDAKVFNMLEKGLCYRADERPHALEMIDCFV